MALKVLIHFMHEHLPFGCQSQQSNVEIGNKIEINYLSRRGSGSCVVERGRSQVQRGRPAGAYGSHKLAYAAPPGLLQQVRLCVEHHKAHRGQCVWDRGTADGTHASFSITFLPRLLQLTRQPASVLLLKYSNTNGF